MADEEIELANQGLFFSPMLRCHGIKPGPGFCKPDKIVIYSAPPPVRMRVVAYRMQLWMGSEQPSAAQIVEGGQHYCSLDEGQKNFTFTTGTIPMTMDQLMTEIRRHFGSIVVRGKQSRDHDNAFARMMEANETIMSNRLTNGDKVRVADVHHRARIAIDTDGSFFDDSQHLRFRGYVEASEKEREVDIRYSDNEYVAVKYEYTDNRELARKALDWMMDYRLRNKIVNRFANQ